MKNKKFSYKLRFFLFIALGIMLIVAIVLCMLPGSSTSCTYKNQEHCYVDSDTHSGLISDSVLNYPKAPYNPRTDESYDEDRADNDEDYDPYDDPDWDESTPGESRPEYFIRGNIPDPELYPEDVVKEWVKEHGTEDEIRDVEEGRY